MFKQLSNRIFVWTDLFLVLSAYCNLQYKLNKDPISILIEELDKSLFYHILKTVKCTWI